MTNIQITPAGLRLKNAAMVDRPRGAPSHNSWKLAPTRQLTFISALRTWTLSDALEHKVLQIRLCGLKIAPRIKTDPASLKVSHKFKEAGGTCRSAGSVLRTPSMPAGRRWGMRSLPMLPHSSAMQRCPSYSPESIYIHNNYNTKEVPVENALSCFCARRHRFYF